MKVWCMEQRPDQPPEGKLISAAANRLDLSIREAARRAGISYGRWRQITTGYQKVSSDVYAPVHAPARTLAKMAAAVGITPGQMESEGQRPDAAEIMRETIPDAPRPGIEPDFPEVNAEMLEAQARYLEEVRLRVELARRRHPGGQLTGQQVFPTSPRDARSWDQLVAAGWAPETVERGLATLQAWESESARLTGTG